MTNYGNTGQRYKMRTFTSASDIGDGRILITLSCGHSYVVVDSSLALFQRFIAQGKRTRCDDCVVETKRV